MLYTYYYSSVVLLVSQKCAGDGFATKILPVLDNGIIRCNDAILFLKWLLVFGKLIKDSS